jgi:peptide/nickel transport system permease protein
MMPGNPIVHLIGEDIMVTPELVEELTATLGLDKPLHEQFLIFIQNLAAGDLGYSYHLHAPVAELILERLPWTLLLVGTALLIGYSIGVLAGAYAGWQTKQKGAKALTFIGFIISCTPPYLLGLVLFSVFVYHLGWFPFKGLYTTPDLASIMWHMTLPIATLSLFIFARNLLIMRGSVLTEKHQLYPQFARSLGASKGFVLHRHVMKNAILPIITQFAIDFGFILSGALFIEIIFSLNAMGSLMYTAILNHDYPILSGLFLVIAVMAIGANILADVLYGIIDPRIWREMQ